MKDFFKFIFRQKKTQSIKTGPTPLRVHMKHTLFFLSQSHPLSEDVLLTTKSLNAVAIFNHLFFCSQTNYSLKLHQYYTHTWVYGKISFITSNFPFLIESQVKKSLNLLVKHDYVLTGNYSKNKFDKTTWYALTAFPVELNHSKNEERN